MSPLSATPTAARYGIALAALAVIVVAVVISTRRQVGIADDSEVGPGSGPAIGAAGSHTTAATVQQGEHVTTPDARG